MSRFPQTIIAVIAILALAAAVFTIVNKPSEPTESTPPVTEAGPDMSGKVGESFTLDGSGSVDEGTIARFEWSLGDGSTKMGIHGDAQLRRGRGLHGHPHGD